jgi:prolyl oligopeptidase
MIRKLGLAFALATLVLLLGADSAQAPAPAATDDPNQWLEDVTGEKALSWVKERNAESTGELTGLDGFKDLEARLLSILDSDDRIPYVGKMGAYYYNFWRDAAHKRGLWRRTTLDEYKKAEPKWETILDLDALAASEKENWVWHGSDCMKPEYKHCLISLSRGGADADVTREFDLATKSFVKDGYFLPEAKGGASWRNADSLFVSTDFGPGSLTESGYPRIVKEWKRGTPLTEAATVFEGKPEDVSVFAYRDLTKGYERDFVRRGVTFWTSEVFVRRDGKLIKIDKPDDANLNVHRDLLFLELRSDWEVGGKKYPAGALLASDFDAFLAGKRDMDVLFTPTERTSLAGYSNTMNYVLLNELDNVHNKVYLMTRK